MHADAIDSLRIIATVSRGSFTLDVDHEITLRGVTGLFGPSGGGKTTLLRVIAGFERPAGARIEFGGEIWQSDGIFVPPHRRPVGFVFQDTHLFEHRSVDGNLRYAAARAGDAGSIAFDEVLATLDLGPLLDRGIDTLSGGERQRVAIGRTLLTQPRLLLLDEPLAALDVGRKGEILPYLEALPERFGIPAIYVSHSIDEIARLADRVVALNRGSVEAVGNTADVLNQLDLHWPGFEIVSVLEARVIEHLPELHLTRLDHHGQAFVVPMLDTLVEGDVARLNVRANDVALATEEPRGLSFRNVLTGTLAGLEIEEDSAFAIASVDIGGAIVRAHLTRHAIGELRLEPGMPVYALLKTASFDRA